jgi:hypothetical protein
MRPRMSEISDSYHLKGTRKDAIALVERLGALGGVLPENDVWTCALISKAPDLVAPSWQGTLLHYLHSPGHETRISLFERGTEVGRILIRYEGQAPKPFSAEPWLERKLLTPEQVKSVEKWVAGGAAGDAKDPFAHQIARMLGLLHFDGLHGRDLDDRWSELKKKYPAFVAVDPEETVEQSKVTEATPRGAPALVDLLLSMGAITLAEGHSAAELHTGLKSVLSQGGKPAQLATRLGEYLVDHPAVDELFVDDAKLAEILDKF